MFRVALFLVNISLALSAHRPCETLFNATFDKDTTDGRNTAIAITPSGSVEVKNTTGCIGGGAAEFHGGVANLAVFNNNDLSDTFQIRFRFQSDVKQKNIESFTTLVNNGCHNGKPSIVIEYLAIARTYRLMVRDGTHSEILQCMQNSTRPWGFHDISLEYQNGHVVFRTDGEVCAEDDGFQGPPAVTPCALSLGGTSKNTTENFWGYFDEVLIRRWCVIQP